MEVDPVDEDVPEEELPEEVEPLFHASFGEHYEDDVLQLLKSDDPGDAWKLKALVLEIIPTDNMRAFEFLMANGYKIEVLNDKNQTCIHLAYYAGSQAILSSSTLWSPNLADNMITCTDTNGLTFLHIACYVADATFVEKCLNSNLDYMAKCYNGFTPLHFASMTHELNIVRLLLESGADVNALDSEDRTPLHVACCTYQNHDLHAIQEHLDIIEFLLKNQSSPSMKDKQGNIPLFSIFPDDYNSFDSVLFPEVETKMKLDLLLKQNVDLTIKNNNNESILHCIIESLQHLRLPSDLSKLSFNDTNHVEMIKKIINLYPTIDLNEKNIAGQTPLQLAVSYLSSDIVKILLEHGADVDTVRFYVINNTHCFYYPYLVPNLESVINIELILSLLFQKEYKLTMEENFNIMKFLVHNVGNCACYEFKSENDMEHRFPKILNFGTLQHTARVFYHLHQSEPQIDLILAIVASILLWQKAGNFYSNSLFKKMLVPTEELLLNDIQDVDSDNKAKIKIAYMKSTTLKNDVTLYDVMVKHPHFVRKYLKNIETYSLVLNITRKYDVMLREIINGHLCYSLIRDYLERTAYDYLECLFPFLPEPCCKGILYYLSEEAILKVCSAALIDFELA